MNLFNKKSYYDVHVSIDVRKFDEWTVFLLTEHPAPATCKKFKSTDSGE